MYLELFKHILSIVNRENDLNGNNIVEKIQKQLQRRESSTYEEWRKENFDINYKFSNNNYKKLILLHVASLDNQENVVNALLAAQGIDVNSQQNLLQQAPLHLAVEGGNENIVKALLAAGADPLLCDYRGKNLAKIVTEEAIWKAVNLGANIFSIASVVAVIVVTSAYFIGVSLSVGAMAGIAVAAAVFTGLVAGGIKYEVYKPCDELKDAIAQATSSPSKQINGS
ncbi:Ankyrin repeat domain protein [Wolbachia endosymbiont of Drosophila simulans wNo]|uniref:ankyrin repeat domain-containing protein n=1 Tax=Wolbachia endosymbiont of Drosophila simulans TaxID=77038 RepID=UPI0002D24AE1|nr:ankyrin repeat domain-containing protein [Wolbachia endosymbiont of Drosophila simulans]AGJ98738.1 Ankyrin repeat domain protein [Wolbachia endosymbiont of Drosophila simulans wNo]